MLGENVTGMQLHVAQNITGQVRGHVDAAKAEIKMTFCEYGVLITGLRGQYKGTSKLVPFGNIQSINFNTPEEN